MERSLGWRLVAITACCCLLPPGVGAESRSYQEAFSEILRLSQLGLTQEEALVPDPRAESPKNVFPCQALAPSASPPTSVHSLRPSDIKVVAALGDSITAGFGMQSTGILTLLKEHRERAFSIGGWETFETAITLPNIVRAVGAAALVGSSQNSTKWLDNPIDRDAAGFNVAVTGSTAQDLLSQARLLTDLLQNDTRVDFQNDWKLLTLFIGGNDLCDSCKGGHSQEDYVGNITATIDYIKQHVPRVFMNLVQVMQVLPLRNVSKPGLLCNLNKIFCSCVLTPSSPAALEELEQLNKDYQRGLETLLASGRYDHNDSFTVTLQPCIRDTLPPTLPDGKVDGSFFAVDCFHFATKGHETFTSMLWNNMMEPEGAKTVLPELIHPPPQLVCPSEESPYLYTRQNSGTAAAASTTTKGSASSLHTVKTTASTTPRATTKSSATSLHTVKTTASTTPRATTKGSATSLHTVKTTASTTPRATTKGSATSLHTVKTTASTTPRATTKGSATSLHTVKTTASTTPRATTKGSATSLHSTGLSAASLMLLPLVGLLRW
ncbi:phospholipase B1, membrane-associated-like isoform X2 [Petromyzon marinus]|uniref:phospholipase B1, membrane-associated-like isoform X2 n=1 Tax=Petromyzon marinus TaxID=7757 RepID=UPI003F716BEB